MARKLWKLTLTRPDRAEPIVLRPESQRAAYATVNVETANGYTVLVEYDDRDGRGWRAWERVPPKRRPGTGAVNGSA